MEGLAVLGALPPAAADDGSDNQRNVMGPGEDRVHQYRPDDELNAKIEGDNLKIVGDMLPAALRKSIEAAEEKRIVDAIAFAEASQFPADREVFEHVFTN